MKEYGGHIENYYRKKRLFWIIFVLLFLITALSFFLFSKQEKIIQGRIITVGICGEIKRKAVYRVPEGSDLAQLIRKGNGLTINADIRKLDLNRILLNDSIYHIPGRSYNGRMNMNTALSEAIAKQYKINPAPLPYPDKAINHLTILYVGFPAVYMLINYYPDQKRVSIVHIPHSTILLNNDYRLIDIFFTLGIDPTIKILENALNQHINYYLIQDRFSFIDLVNMLDGIDLPVDQPFAEAYHLKSGNEHVDGFYAWEYIRFLDMKRMNRKLMTGKGADLVRTDNFKIPSKDLQLGYEMRQYRQRNVMNALRHAYGLAGAAEKVTIIRNIMKSFDTNIGMELVSSLYSDVLSTPSFSYATIPGYYSDDDDQLYYYPDIPAFKLMRNEEIRQYLGQDKNKKPQVIY
jgi:anionic cell wall polymer biosynthesis LytR-Cps2A-Psr (LCP) family protein